MSRDYKINIRKPSLSDLPDLLTLWQGQCDYHYDLDPVYYVPSSPQLNRKFTQYLKKAITKSDPYVLLAESGSKLIGFVTFKKVTDHYFDTNITKYGEVIELYVSPNYRRRGVGQKLMTEVETFLRNLGLNYISLQCSSFNRQGLDFYQKTGFVTRQYSLYKKI